MNKPTFFDLHVRHVKALERIANALETVIEKRVERGELVTLQIGRRGLAGLFGKYRDDPTLQDICDEAYKESDADVRE